jgi:pimeloyl-ACP methyl ester carboxylesterase
MEIMAGAIKGSQLEVLEGAEHFPFVDRPDTVVSLTLLYIYRSP